MYSIYDNKVCSVVSRPCIQTMYPDHVSRPCMQCNSQCVLCSHPVVDFIWPVTFYCKTADFISMELGVIIKGTSMHLPLSNY